jgi:hypothetical protein
VAAEIRQFESGGSNHDRVSIASSRPNLVFCSFGEGVIPGGSSGRKLWP